MLTTADASTRAIRATVVYPAPQLRRLKITAVRQRKTLGELVRGAVTAALESPDRLVEAAAAQPRAAGARTGLDLPAAQHHQLKMLAAEHGVTLAALILAAVAAAEL